MRKKGEKDGQGKDSKDRKETYMRYIWVDKGKEVEEDLCSYGKKRYTTAKGISYCIYHS